MKEGFKCKQSEDWEGAVLRALPSSAHGAEEKLAAGRSVYSENRHPGKQLQAKLPESVLLKLGTNF